LNNYFAWFACAVYLILVCAFDYAVQNNLHPENPPDPARMWYVLAGFITFTLWGTIRMLAKFLRPPEERCSLSQSAWVFSGPFRLPNFDFSSRWFF